MKKPIVVGKVSLTKGLNQFLNEKKPKKFIPQSLDILTAAECINWTLSKIPQFQNRLHRWIEKNVSIELEDTGSENDIVVATGNERFPLAFNVEYGAYLNTLRSSLDILASALARRVNFKDETKVSFPIAASQEDFIALNFKASVFYRALPEHYQKIISNLKPYKNGSDALYDLHQLDIIRKHRQLLFTEIHPITMSVSHWGDLSPYTAISGGPFSAGGKTALFLWKKGEGLPVVTFCPHIMVLDVTTNSKRLAIPLLYEFSDTALKIIKEFDID